MAIDFTNYTQTVVAKPTAPSTTSIFDLTAFAPLIREKVATRIVDEPIMQRSLTAASSFFNGETIMQVNDLVRDLRFGQQLVVPVLKDQNPFSLYSSSSMSYNAVDSCHDQIVLSCTMPCVNTMPEFDELLVRFDTEYSYGVKMCDKNRDFWPVEFFTQQYQKSREAEQFGMEVDLWNKVIRANIAAPATTVDVTLAAKHPTHFWEDLGDAAANAIDLIREAVWYFTTNFQGFTPTVFITAEMAQTIIESMTLTIGANNTISQVNTLLQWDTPGFMVDEQVRRLFGNVRYVVIMERSPWMTYATTTTGENPVTTFTTNYPLWSTDATSEYVVIADPRAGYRLIKDGYHLVINPYDCDKLTRGMQDTEYVSQGATFPQYCLILEFNKIQLKQG